MMPTLKRLSLFVFVCAVTLAFAGGACCSDAFQLTILHTNDIHGHLFPFDYDALGKMETDVGGAARRASLIRQLRKDAGHPVLLMDAGDLFMRGPIADLRGEPDFAVMNAVPYDIMTLGNNEFKGAEGLEGQMIMRERIKQAAFPIVCANVIDKSTGGTLVQPYKIFSLNGFKIGVFGLTAPRVAEYGQAKGLEIADPIETAKKIVPELAGKCDAVIALTHIGYSLDLQLASAVPGMAAIIGGDSHTWLFQPTLVKREESGSPDWWVGGTIICQDGEWGKCLGVLDLTLRKAPDGRYLVSKYSGRLATIDSSTAPAADVEKLLNEFTKPFTKLVGRNPHAVPKSAAASWVAERMRQATGTQVAVEPNSGVENGLRAGEVTELDIRRMIPYNNRIVRLRVTGKQLSGFFAENESGLAGAENRGGALYVAGKIVQPDGSYTLAVEDYFARTSRTLAGLPVVDPDIPVRDAVAKYIRSGTK